MVDGVRELRLVVTADDYDAALTFYRDVLGLPERGAFSSPDGGRVTILEAGREVAGDGVSVRLTVDSGDRSVLPLLRRLDDAGIAVSGFRVARPTLDDVFLTLTGRSLRDADDTARPLEAALR